MNPENAAEYLRKNGYDGLYYPDDEGCGCELDNLELCGESCIRCVPGYNDPNIARQHGLDFWIQPVKPEKPENPAPHSLHSPWCADG